MSKQKFRVQDGIVFPDGTTQTTAYVEQATPSYKGFKAHYGRMFNSEPTLSKLVIYKDTVSPSSVIDNSTEDDLFQVSGLTGSDIVALFVIAGSDDTNPVDLVTLKSFVEAAVDNVILVDGVEGDVRNAADMKTAFYNNYATLAATAGSLYSNFQFLNYNDYYNVSASTIREGSGASILLSDNNAGGYNIVSILNGGINYLPGHRLVASGNLLGGTAIDNDAIITVSAVDSNGAITSATVSGTSFATAPQPGWEPELSNYNVGSGLNINSIYYNRNSNSYQFDGWTNGNNYVAGDVITILGSNIQQNGTGVYWSSPDNDVTVTINEVYGSGNINTYTISGNLPVDTGTWPSNNINDGGNDQYDTGNYISTDLETDISYNSGNVVSGSSAVGGGDYVVVYNNSIFGFFASGAAISSIKTDGGSGFDGDGSADTGSLYGSSGVDLGDFIFVGNTMSVPGDDNDMYIKAGDDLYLDALDDDIHIRADDDIRFRPGYNFTEDSYNYEYVFNNSGELRFYDSNNGDMGYVRMYQNENGNRTISLDGTNDVAIRSDNQSYTWAFRRDGKTSFPGVIFGQNGTLGLASDSGMADNGQYLQVRAGDIASHIHLDTSNNEAYDLYVGNDNKYFKLDKAGSAVIGTYNSSNGDKHTVSFYNGEMTSSKTLTLAVEQNATYDLPASNENPDNNFVIWLVKADVAGYANIQPDWTVEINGDGVRRAIASVGDTNNATLYSVDLADTSVAVPYRANLKFYEPNRQWEFNNAGDLVLAGKLKVGPAGPTSNPEIASVVVTNNGTEYQGMVLTPDPDFDVGQGLKIYPTVANPEANHLHVTANDPATVDLFLGDDNNYVKIESGGAGVSIGTFDAEGAVQKAWSFDLGGNLTLPAGGDIKDSNGVSVLGGGGTTLPANDNGYLRNDGAGTLTWQTNTVAAGMPAFTDTVVISTQNSSFWSVYELTGTFAPMFPFQSSSNISLSNQVVYGHQWSSGDKGFVVNDAAIQSNTYGMVIEFPANPVVGDSFSVNIMGDYQEVNAGSFVVGRQYMIKTVGTTSWTSIGASMGSQGTIFTATGAGSGTGVAYVAKGVDRKIFVPAAGQRVRIQATGGATGVPYYIGASESIKGIYNPTLGTQEGQTTLFIYVGVLDSVPTWYQVYF